MIYLASKSPRRRELLLQAGIAFECINSEIDEAVKPNESPKSYVERMAWNKSQAGCETTSRYQTWSVLAADTAVVVDQKILGKPIDNKNAIEMLSELSGRTHKVMTSVAVTDGITTQLATSVTDVTFAKLSQQDIEAYIATGDCYDKAGSYGIQGYAARFVEAIRGSYTGVVGLPLFETARLLDYFEKLNSKD